MYEQFEMSIHFCFALSSGPKLERNENHIQYTYIYIYIYIYILKNREYGRRDPSR
jgi:hypothetical protein